jgi:hypothetical protein
MRQRVLLLIIFSWTSVVASAQSAEDVINRYIEFTGGGHSWKKIVTIISSGEYNYGGMPFPFTTYSKAPDLYKLIVPFNGKFYAQGYDGKRGWKIDAFKNESKATSTTGKEARALANEADVELESPFIDYLSKGHQATVTGKDTVQGKMCNIIRFVRKTGEIEQYYFDTTTGELRMKLAPSKNAELKETMLKIYYKDYRDVGGVKLPFVTSCESEGQVILVITIKDVVLNKPIDNAEFEP